MRRTQKEGDTEGATKREHFFFILCFSTAAGLLQQSKSSYGGLIKLYPINKGGERDQRAWPREREGGEKEREREIDGYICKEHLVSLRLVSKYKCVCACYYIHCLIN